MNTENTEHIEKMYHKTVLVNEVLSYLDPQPNKLYCDVTFGSGGHTRAILDYEPKCSVVALDWDVESLDTYAPELEKMYQDRLQFLWGNFAHLYRILKKAKITQVDGILADFGTSQMHLKERAGFSFSRDSVLDMRMSPAHQQVTAEQVVNKASEKKLCEIFWQLGQEQHAKIIAKKIVEIRQHKKISTTRQLAELVKNVVPYHGRTKIHPATKIFQALRMYVNHELNNIHAFLSAALQVIRPGGLLLCISFHSLEDRVVKEFFKDMALAGKLEIITKKVVTPSQEEMRKNPSSRSAKLRVARILKNS